jgi:hypothetical protein
MLIVGCAGKVPTQTPLMKEAGGVQITASELRILTFEYSRYFSTSIELAADEIRASSTDPDIRYNALLWKSYATPAMQRAAFQRDPFAALIDMRAFLIQMMDYFTTGTGKDLFGPHQSIAVNTCNDLETIVMSLYRRTQPDRDSVRQDQQFSEWAAENPIDSPLFVRRSTRPLLSEITAMDAKGGMAGVAQINESMAGLTDRVETYTDILPKQIRWQGELLLHDYLGKKEVPGFFSDVNTINNSADRIADFLDGVEGLVAEERAIVLGELSARLDEAYAEIDRQRLAVTADLGEQREAIMTDIGMLTESTIDYTVVGVDKTVDRIFAKATRLLIGLLLGLLVVGAILIVLARLLRRPIATVVGA